MPPLGTPNDFVPEKSPADNHEQATQSKFRFLKIIGVIVGLVVLLLVLNPFAGMFVFSELYDRVELATENSPTQTVISEASLHLTSIEISEVAPEPAPPVFQYVKDQSDHISRNVIRQTKSTATLNISGMNGLYSLADGKQIRIPTENMYAKLAQTIVSYLAEDGFTWFIDVLPTSFIRTNVPKRVLLISPAEYETKAAQLKTFSVQLVDSSRGSQYHRGDPETYLAAGKMYDYPLYQAEARDCRVNGAAVSDDMCDGIFKKLATSNTVAEYRIQGFPCVIHTYPLTPVRHGFWHDGQHGICNPKDVIGKIVQLIPVYGGHTGTQRSLSEPEEFKRETFTVTKEVQPYLGEGGSSPYTVAVNVDGLVVQTCGIERDLWSGEGPCDVQDVVFAENGPGFAYWTGGHATFVRLPDSSLRLYRNTPMLDLNGQWGALKPMFSDDGIHVLYVAGEEEQYSFPEHNWDKYHVVLLDGAEIGRYLNSQRSETSIVDLLTFSPNGMHVAYRVKDGDEYFAVVDKARTPAYSKITNITIENSGQVRFDLEKNGKWYRADGLPQSQ